MDLKALTSNVVAIVMVIGLCVVPCLFAWFNVLSNWAPFEKDATSRIPIAVAVEDKGIETLGLKTNVGDKFKETVAGNDMIDWIKGKEEYAQILDAIGNKLGEDRLKVFHAHFSKIEFTVSGGEKRHLTFAENNGFGPDYEPLMELVAKRGLAPTFICESAGTQDIDALTMKQYYLKALEK